jgi:hypothetical protein
MHSRVKYIKDLFSDKNELILKAGSLVIKQRNGKHSRYHELKNADSMLCLLPNGMKCHLDYRDLTCQA